MKTCAYCGRENDDAALSCTGCGIPLVEAPAPSSEPKARRRLPDLHLRYAGYILGLLMLYLLSFGPVTYYFCKVTSTSTSTGLAYTHTVTIRYPMVIGILYYPAMLLEDTEWGRETYGSYLAWWRERRAKRLAFSADTSVP